ncbi:MAG: DeoR family transcriptional regulator [Pseudomonadota bacterium]|nr:DeoR family transcriptional regulator [Pseudomonadota bacterium]
MGGPTALTPRQQQLLSYVQIEGYASVEALSGQFSVTPQTIRRDIGALCARGLLSRHHGGAGLPPSNVENISYQQRRVLNLEAKQRIGRAVARDIPENASLFINIGTTTEEVAKALRHHQGLRVITNNLNVVMILSANPSTEVIVTGGTVRNQDRGITSEATIDFVNQFVVDFGVIGISGIEPDGTLLDYDYHEVRVTRAIVEHSRRVLLVTDHSKFGRSALVRLGPMDLVDDLYTDMPPSEELQGAIEQASTRLHITSGHSGGESAAEECG